MPGRCKHEGAKDARKFYQISYACGAWICGYCNHHAHVNSSTGEITQTLTRCYCGWSESGGNGIEELRDLGENVEDDY